MRAGRVSAVWVILACGMSQAIHNVYGSVVNIALPAISDDLGAGLDSLQWLVSAYILALASSLAFAGILADRFGRRRIMVTGDLVMVAGSIVCALSDTVPLLIAGRVVQGIGSALIAPAGLALLTADFPRTTPRAVSVMWWTTIGSASLAAGPILGGLLVHDLGWRWVFWAGVPLGLVAFALALLLRESRPAKHDPFDPVGMVLVTGLLGGLSFALIEAPKLGWSSAGVLIAAGLAVVCLIALVPYESRHPHPLVPVQLFADRGYATALATCVVGYLALAGLLFLNTFYLQSQRGLSATTAGLLTIPLALGATAASLLAPEFVVRHRSTLALQLSGGLIVVGSLGLWLTDQTPLWTVVVPYLVFGFGFGLIADPVSVTGLASLPPDKAGLASSMISTAKQAGQLLGVAILGAVLAAQGVASETLEFERMGTGAWLLLIGLGAVIVLLNVAHRTSRDAPTRLG